MGCTNVLRCLSNPTRTKCLRAPNLYTHIPCMNLLIRQGLRRASQKMSEGRDDSAEILIPKNDDDLWQLVVDLWNIEIPRVAVCTHKGHVAPFDAFSEAFFARTPISIWHASRGLGGKSVLLATLALTEAVVLAAKVNLLGGSGEQSERVLKYMYGEEVPNIMWGSRTAPKYLVSGGYERGALKKETALDNGGYIRALMASSRSVRGPHPERLRLDEIDEMDLGIFDAAMGQTMAVRGIPAQTVGSSTWHNASGTMTEILRRAEDKGWPVRQWCYKENLKSNGGWLPDEEVGRKKSETSDVMFQIEYDLQEPNPEDRAIDPQSVIDMFNPELGEYAGSLDQTVRIEEPKKGFRYYIGTDWAKRTDFTIIWVFKEYMDGEDTRFRLVSFMRTGRKPWPALVSMLERTKVKFVNVAGEENVFSLHDETGIGDVISDYMEDGVSTGVWMAGRLRATILSDYISALEHGMFEAPMIKWAYKEHEYASVDDIFGSGHLPDTIQAGALAYHAFKTRPKKIRVRATWGT